MKSVIFFVLYGDILLFLPKIYCHGKVNLSIAVAMEKQAEP